MTNLDAFITLFNSGLGLVVTFLLILAIIYVFARLSIAPRCKEPKIKISEEE